MATLKKYNLKGKKTGEVDMPEIFVGAKANAQSLKDYIVAYHANQRQWSANTQTRSEVNHSNKKPRPQKGSGGARQGSLASTQFRGGGRPHGPKPKFDQHVKVNKKERQANLKALIAAKMQEGFCVVLEDAEMDKPKTKEVADLLKKLKIDRRVLFVDSTPLTKEPSKLNSFKLSLNNIPQASYRSAHAIHGYDVAVAKNLVVTQKALDELVEWLSPKNEKVAS